ncbi:unnamed protein product [Camellia sinensis]
MELKQVTQGQEEKEQDHPLHNPLISAYKMETSYFLVGRDLSITFLNHMLSYITHRGPAKEVFSFPKPLGFLILHKDIHLHLVYGQRSKLKPGNRL